MGSFYSDLFKYRASEDRVPLEDALSEALAGLLNRMPTTDARTLLGAILKQAGVADEHADALWPVDARAEWITQLVVQGSDPNGGGRADIALRLTARDASRTSWLPLIIENKVSCTFQPAQMERYAAALKTLSGGRGSALLLLTHATEPDEEFGLAPCYDGITTGKLYWPALARHLRLISREDSEGDRRTTWKWMASELAQFLKENGMAYETATSSDLAALQLFLPSADRIKETVEQLWNAGRDSVQRLCGGARNLTEYDPETGSVWTWAYLTAKYSSWVAVGIRVPDASVTALNQLAGGRMQIFAEAWHRPDRPVFGQAMPAGFAESRPEHIATARAISELPVDPEEFRIEASRWAAEQLSALAAAYSPPAA
jgi:hypothetical protein